MQIKTLLTLGRVSNLPTIWTNVLAAAVLAQAGILAPDITTVPDHLLLWQFNLHSLMLWSGVLLALSLMYAGGMFLNDAFDAQWDRENGNLRPIVNGDVSERMVWVTGSLLLCAAVFVIAVIYTKVAPSTDLTPWYQNYYGLLAGIMLASVIILYNASHKHLSHSAFIMGSCRSGVYLIGALLLAQVTVQVVLAAMAILFYIAGVTYLARHEHANRVNRLWPFFLLYMPVIVAVFIGYNLLYFWFFLAGYIVWVRNQFQLLLRPEKTQVKAFIGGLLAAIPLLDGLMLASVNAIIPSLVCLLVFLFIPRLHRWISGT